MTSSLTITRFAGRAASVNAWIVSNATHALVIDALRSEVEAAELADLVAQSGKVLWGVFVTHGHPDHYVGLRTLKERFPEARLLVATQAVKDDIVGFSLWMESVGWLEQIPRMKVKSAAHPDGFDYAAAIEVLDSDVLELPDGGRFEVRADYPAIEAAHMTTLYCAEANALFTADMVYHGVHAWAGASVSRQDITNWMAAIADLKLRHVHGGVVLYPGHGAPGGLELLDITRTYLADFLAAADRSHTNEEMIARLKRLYPAHEQADFILLYSVLAHGPGQCRHHGLI